MLILLKKKPTQEEIEKMLREFTDYIKVVIDIKEEILVGGAERHFDEEQLLLQGGSKQEDLWGGGVDWQSKEVDYNSMINLRPQQDNPSRDILSVDIRRKFDEIVNKLFFE